MTSKYKLAPRRRRRWRRTEGGGESGKGWDGEIFFALKLGLEQLEIKSGKKTIVISFWIRSDSSFPGLEPSTIKGSNPAIWSLSCIKILRCWVLNHGSFDSEATALPIGPQPHGRSCGTVLEDCPERWGNLGSFDFHLFSLSTVVPWSTCIGVAIKLLCYIKSRAKNTSVIVTIFKNFDNTTLMSTWKAGAMGSPCVWEFRTFKNEIST